MSDRSLQNSEVRFSDAFRVWLRIGWLSFGGPAGQIALMHRELVEKRRWIDESRFLHALNYCMLLPGPEAQQLATYIGWLLHRTRGGIVAGLCFVLPGAAAILLLSVLYVRYGHVPLVTWIFFGLKAAVLAIVVEAVVRIGRRALKSRFLLMIAALAFVAIAAFAVPFPLIVIGAGVLGALASRMLPPQSLASARAESVELSVVERMQQQGALEHTRPSPRREALTAAVCLLVWIAPVVLVALLFGGDHVLTRAGIFFSQTAVVTFGGAYAVLAYVAQHAVQNMQWLTSGEMLDGLALAETTPGPLIMVLQFVGFIAGYRYAGTLDPWLAATLAAALTTWVTFVPSFLFVLVGAPYMEALKSRRALNAALAAITAAVVGVILNLSVWFAMRTLFGTVHHHEIGPLRFDSPEWSTIRPVALALTVVAIMAMLRIKVPLGWVLLGSAASGICYGWLT